MSWTLLPKEDYKTETPTEAQEGPCELAGDEGQRIGVIQSLPFRVTANEPQCMQQVLSSANAEFPVPASSTFLTILEKKLVHPRTFTQTFLQSILSTIDSRDPVVATAWLDTLLDVIDLLPATVIKSDILPVAIAKGQISEPISARLTACKLLGKIATKFESYMFKKEVLPLIHSLCQDVNYEVRACICSQLHYVASSLDTETVKPVLLPSLVELASDEESHVRLEAVETIVNMLPNLQADALKFTIIPLVKKMCEESLRAEDSVMVKISEQFGKLCLGLGSFFTPEEKEWMLQHYQKMAELGLPQVMKSNVPDYGVMPDVVPANTDNHVACRHNCAYNLPAMTMFCSTAGNVDNFVQQLYSTFQNLACDPYFMIRQTIACGLYEIAQLLGSASSVLKPELIRLLRDDAEEVLQVLVPHLGETLVLLAKAGAFSSDFMDCGMVDIGQALLKCEAEISMTTNWRLHAMILGQLECLPQCVPSDFIYTHFIPIIFDRIHTARPVPCRLAAARTMLVFLRYNVKQTQRNAIRAHIDTDLCCSDSCYKRMLYVNMCDTAMDLFSRSYFKEYFFMPLIGLSDDQVPNIRLKVVVMLPKLKAMLYLPGDHKLLTSLEACVCNLLLHEKDRDVKAQLQLTVQALDAIEVGVEVVGSQTPTSKETIEDQRKADEEKKLSGSVSPLSQWKVGGQTDAKRRSLELKNATELPIAERRSCLSNIPVSRPIRRSIQHPTTLFDGYLQKSSVNSWQFAAATNSICQQAQQANICLAKHNVMECCSHSHFQFPPNFSSPEDHDFAKCTAENKEMRLHTLHLSSSGVLSQLKAETTNPNSNVDMRAVNNARGDTTTNLHDFSDSTSDAHPADLLNFECKLYAFGGMPGPQYGPCLYHTSYSLDTNNEVGNCESAKRLIVSSLEDEFYVDAGIQIPQQLATSGFTPLPSRIPNVREILFRNRSTLSDTDLQKEVKTDCEVSSDARDNSLKSQPNFGAAYKVSTRTSNVSAASKSPVSVNATKKKASLLGNMNRRNSGIFNDEVDSQTQHSPRGKLIITNKQKPSLSSTVANRQQSYMEKDKAVKVKTIDINKRKKVSGTSENHTESCLERLQVTASDDSAEKCNETHTVRKSNMQSQNLSEAKLSATNVTNRRHSYISVMQNQSNATDILLTKRSAASNCQSTGTEAHKSVVNSQSHIKRGISLDRETVTNVTVSGGTVKRRSMVTPSTVKRTVWRHSSLERDSMDRLTVQAHVQAKSVNRMVDINKIECSRNTQRELHSVVDDVGSGSKGNSTSRIPRGGGGTSCHSSPGNSRSTSPTILASGSSGRLHQRTAPNSRASSPTGAEKLKQRLSVGSLSCYLGTLKLAEPGTSRLPVRNFSRLQ